MPYTACRKIAAGDKKGPALILGPALSETVYIRSYSIYIRFGADPVIIRG